MDFMDGISAAQVYFWVPCLHCSYSCFSGSLIARRTRAEKIFAVSPPSGVFEAGGTARLGGGRWNIPGVWGWPWCCSPLQPRARWEELPWGQRGAHGVWEPALPQRGAQLQGPAVPGPRQVHQQEEKPPDSCHRGWWVFSSPSVIRRCSLAAVSHLQGSHCCWEGCNRPPLATAERLITINCSWFCPAVPLAFLIEHTDLSMLYSSFWNAGREVP